MLAATLLVPILLGGQTPANETKEQKAARQHQEDLRRDEEQGKKYAAEVEKQTPLSTNKEYNERVQRVGGTIAAIANKTSINVLWGDKRLNPFTYEYKVIKGDDVNAFSIPGGHIYVYEGLMKRVESDDELAGVLAHETAHAEERHVATLQREAGKVQNLTLPLILLAILTGGAGAAAATLGGTGLVTQALGSGWSVKAEESADYGGFQYMVQSPYDPTGMLTFMERLARLNQLSDSINWGIYTTHPPSRERAETLTGYMNAARVPIRRSRVAASYRTTVKDTVGGGVALMFGGKTLTTFAGTDAKARGLAAADKVNAFFDKTPALFELKPGPDGAIMGDGTVLYQVAPADAEFVRQTPDAAQAQALKAMQLALVTTGGRVWQTL